MGFQRIAWHEPAHRIKLHAKFKWQNVFMSDAIIKPPKTGEPAIHRAARCGLHDEIKSLVMSGADLNLVFDMNIDPSNYPPFPMTPLMVAAGSGDGASVDTVELLISLGADVNISIESETAACLAFKGLGPGYEESTDTLRLEFLLQSGDPLPQIPEKLNRIFCSAAEFADIQSLTILHKFGADPNGYWDREKALEDSRKLAQYMNSGSYFQGLEISDELKESFEQIRLTEFDDFASAPSSFEIPLFCAAESGNAACVSYLLNIGANPFAKNNSSETAIFSATSSEVFNLLISSGLSLDERNQFGWPPLSSALSDGTEGIDKVKALITCGADVNATFDQGYTVFMSAAADMSRDVEILKILIEAGANPHAITDLGYNAFHAAVDVNGEANEPDSVRSILTYLKSLDVDIEAVNNRLQTPLTRAINEGTGIETLVLCELGANVNHVAPMMICGEDSCTWPELALIFHASIGAGIYVDIKTQALLRAGANPLATDADSFTALDLTVSQLCAGSDNYEILFDEFFSNFPDINQICDPLTNYANTYADQVEGAVRAYIENFAGQIPFEDSADYMKNHRLEMIGSLTWLSIYSNWYQSQNQG